MVVDCPIPGDIVECGDFPQCDECDTSARSIPYEKIYTSNQIAEMDINVRVSIARGIWGL